MKEALLNELQALLDAKAQDWTEADRRLAVACATDLGILMSTSSVGATISSEDLAVAKAAAKNIAAAAQVSGASLINEAIQKTIAGVFQRFILA